MTTYRLTAPRKMGTVPEGFSFTVATGSNCGPSNDEIRRALKPYGFDPQGSVSFGNWKSEKL